MQPDAPHQSNRLLAILCASTAALSVIFLLSASRYFGSPDDRDADAKPFNALEYLRMRPFDSAGYLALSAAPSEGAPDGAERLRTHAVRLASQLAPVDPQVLRAEAALALSTGDVRRGLDKVARLAAISPVDTADALGVLAGYIGHPAWGEFVAGQLSAGWSVADQFLGKVCNDPAHANQAFDLAVQFARYRPLSTQASQCAENRAIAAGNVQGAYRLRLSAASSLPPKIGFVFNGDFELPFSGSQFDWMLDSGGEYREGFVASVRPEGGPGGPSKALVVRFTGRPITATIARQYLALPAGRYEMTYLSKRTNPSGNGSPIWVLRCAGSGVPVITQPWTGTAAGSGWEKSSVTFTVGVNCSGQVLSFEASSKLSALEGLRGSLTLDDVRIEQQ